MRWTALPAQLATTFKGDEGDTRTSSEVSIPRRGRECKAGARHTGDVDRVTEAEGLKDTAFMEHHRRALPSAKWEQRPRGGRRDTDRHRRQVSTADQTA
jgi:hypothetical protein